MRNVLRLVALLNNKLRTDQPKNNCPLNENECAALVSLNKALISPPVFNPPRQARKYTPDRDDFQKQIGCVQLQEQEDGSTRPVGYGSPTITDKERELTTTQKDCLAVVWEIVLLSLYLEGTCFTARTDYEALNRILAMTKAAGMLTRWRLRLSKF